MRDGIRYPDFPTTMLPMPREAATCGECCLLAKFAHTLSWAKFAHILSWQCQSACWRAASKCSVSAAEHRHTSKKTTPRQELQTNRTSGAATWYNSTNDPHHASDLQQPSNIATTTRQRIATCSHRYYIMMQRDAPSTNASASGKQRAATCLHRISHIVTTGRQRTTTSHIVCQRGATCNNATASG